MRDTRRPTTEATIPVPVSAQPLGATQPLPVPGAAGEPSHNDPASWWTLADGEAVATVRPLPSRRRTLIELGLAAFAVFALVVVGTSFAASRLAEREAVNDAAHTTNLLALSVIQPQVTDALLAGDQQAYARLDRVVRESVLPNGIVRVKLWRPDGTIIYADEIRLVGQRFVLGEEQRDTLAHPQTRAEVSDLDRSENEFERYGGCSTGSMQRRPSGRHCFAGRSTRRTVSAGASQQTCTTDRCRTSSAAHLRSVARPRPPERMGAPISPRRSPRPAERSARAWPACARCASTSTPPDSPMQAWPPPSPTSLVRWRVAGFTSRCASMQRPPPG